MPNLTTCVVASDPISREGVTAQLRRQSGITLVEPDGDAEVAVVVTDEVDEAALHSVRTEVRAIGRRVLVVVARANEEAVLAAIEAGASGLLRRSDADGARLAGAVAAASQGEGTLPPDLLGRLLDSIGRLQRQVLTPRGLSIQPLAARELDVLRLVADGYDTAEIAAKLCYSERTVKNVLHTVTSRLNLRNRSHAVAFALKAGLL